MKLYVEKLPKNCEECGLCYKEYEEDEGCYFTHCILDYDIYDTNEIFYNNPTRPKDCPLKEITRKDVEHFENELDRRERENDKIPAWLIKYFTTPEEKRDEKFKKEVKALFDKEPELYKKSFKNMIEGKDIL